MCQVRVSERLSSLNLACELDHAEFSNIRAIVLYVFYLLTYQTTANIDDVLYLLQDLYSEVEPKRFDSQRSMYS